MKSFLLPQLALISLSAFADTFSDCADEPTIQIGDNIAIADTQYGKVKGFISNGIYTYMGIPYGADTGGENRFMAPKPRLPWVGIRPTVFPGNSSPQNIYDRSPDNYSAFVDHWNYDEMSEDCLFMNIWTPKPDNKKRPVLVWLHGGGFVRGNGLEQDGYHGEAISKYGDIVFCSINHRLGPFGFSDLTAIDPVKFKESGVVGMLDIVFALKWIQQNIANFGGDPDNVTIMGQSGGGAKVCILAAMPEAKGLFQKAVSLSGSTQEGRSPEISREFGIKISEKLKSRENADSNLQEMAWKQYMDLAYQAESDLNQSGKFSENRRGWFSPVADGVHIHKGIFYTNPELQYPDIPMIFCTTAHEWGPARFHPEYENITFPELKEKLNETFGYESEKILNAFCCNFPHLSPIEIWSLIQSSRKDVIKVANGKSFQKSPVYMAWFTWESPLFDGRMRSFHCLDISFWFLNTQRMATHTGGGSRPWTLSTIMADALLSFMRTGTPNTPSLPDWKPYSKENGETMILNDICRMENDPDRVARRSLESL